MTLGRRIRVGGAILIALLAVSFVFLGNQRPAHAATSLGSQIVCLVFSNLNDFGSPIPHLTADGCPTTPATGGALTVTKMVVNTGGGAAVSSDFSIHIKSGGTDIGGSPVPGSPSGTTLSGITAGSYTVSESGGPSGYTASFVGDCNSDGVVAVTSGATATCTITNTYSGGGGGGGGTTMGGLIVKKVVVGSSTSPSAFSFTLNGGAAKAFNANGENDLTLATGTYSVVETAVTNFTPSYSGCSAALVTAGATTTCTITNTYSGGGGGGIDTRSDLSLTKSADKSTAVVGDHVTYTITVTNGGPANAAGVSVTDVLPAGMTYVSDDGAGAYVSATGVWTVGALANGAHAVLHIVANVTVSAAGTSVINSAIAADTNGDPTSANNTASTSVAVAAVSPTSSDLAVSKVADKVTANVGDNVTYTISVANAGPATASGVAVTDTLPSALTYVSDDSTNNYSTSTGIWSVGTIGNGGTATLHIVAKINAGTAGQTITNTALVSDANGDPNSSNNSTSTSVAVNAPPTGGGNNNNNGGGPTPTTPGNGGGGNGPIVGSIGGGGGGGGNGPIIVAGGKVLGASTSTVSGSCSEYLTAFIKADQNNDPAQVLKLQAFLIMYEKANIKPTGVYDAATQAATEAFQQQYGADVLSPWGLSAPTGYVYLTTRKEVNEIYCHFTQKFPLTASEQAIISAAARSASYYSGAVVPTASSHKAAPRASSKSSDTSMQAVMTDESVTASSTGSDTATTSGAGSSSGGFWSHFFGH